LFPAADRALGRFVDRRLFHAPDYRDAARQLGDAVRSLYSERDVTEAWKPLSARHLALRDVRSIPLSSLVAEWPAEIHEGQIVELGPR